jgi:hypothetical protein
MERHFFWEKAEKRGRDLQNALVRANVSPSSAFAARHESPPVVVFGQNGP